MKELSDSTEKFLVSKSKGHRTRVIKNNHERKDSDRIISRPQEVFYKTEKTYKMRFKKSYQSSRYYSEILERYIKRFLDRE